jgi:hypothetical protein
MSSLNKRPAAVNANGPAPRRGYVTDCLATSRGHVVAWADTLDDLIFEVEQVFDAGLGEDVVCWVESRVAAVFTDSGKVVRLPL